MEGETGAIRCGTAKYQQDLLWLTCAAILGDGNINGFGLEFFIETASDELPDEMNDIKRCWQFQLLYTVSQLAAGEKS